MKYCCKMCCKYFFKLKSETSLRPQTGHPVRKLDDYVSRGRYIPLMRRAWYKPVRLFCVMAEPWTRSGIVKGIGIPAPSGGRSVGCVDLMHKVNPQQDLTSLSIHLSLHHYLGQFEGDDHGGLLVRLFYPAQLNPNQPPGSPSTYAPWNPHKRYNPAIALYMYFTYNVQLYVCVGI